MLTGQQLRVDFDERGETLILPLQTSWKTIGGAFVSLLFVGVKFGIDYQRHDLLILYVAGAVFAFACSVFILNAVTAVFGREELNVHHGELTHTWRILFARRQAKYSVRQIGDLRVGSSEDEGKKSLASPLSDFEKRGAVQFTAGSKAVRLGVALDERQAAQVVVWLSKRLPRGATVGQA